MDICKKLATGHDTAHYPMMYVILRASNTEEVIKINKVVDADILAADGPKKLVIKLKA